MWDINNVHDMYRHLKNSIIYTLLRRPIQKHLFRLLQRLQAAAAVDTKLLVFFILFYLYTKYMLLNFRDFRNMEIFMEKKT